MAVADAAKIAHVGVDVQVPSKSEAFDALLRTIARRAAAGKLAGIDCRELKHWGVSACNGLHIPHTGVSVVTPGLGVPAQHMLENLARHR